MVTVLASRPGTRSVLSAGSSLVARVLGTPGGAVESASLSRIGHDGAEGAECEVVVDPVRPDDQEEDQGKKDDDAGDRDAASLTGPTARAETC